MKTVLVGNVVTWRGVLKNESGVEADPSGAVYMRVQKPDDTETTYEYGVDSEVVKNGTGDYQIVLTPATTETGVWDVRLAGFTSGAAFWAAVEEPFKVASSVFATP